MFLRTHTALALTVALAFCLPAVSGCSTNTGGNDYKAHQAHQAYSITYASVTDVRTATIHGNTSDHQTLGGMLGSVAGGLLGSTIGGGSGRVVAAAGGALLGGAAGIGAGTLTSKETGLQISLRYDDGREEMVVQGPEPAVQVGQRVRVVIGADGSRRVEPAY